MEFIQTSLSGVVLCVPKRFTDERGFFSETYSARVFANASIVCDFVQDNHSLSRKAGTVRGLHFQAPPHAQAKLVRCVRGRVLDVAVDIRRGSPTFAQSFSAELSAENGRQLLIGKGFLHGFVTLEPDTEIVYKCDDYYTPESDGAVLFSDPQLAIDWGGIDNANAILSERDASAPTLAQFETPFIYEG